MIVRPFFVLLVKIYQLEQLIFRCLPQSGGNAA